MEQLALSVKHIIQRKDGNSEGKFLKSVELVDEQLTCNICQYLVGLSDGVKKKKSTVQMLILKYIPFL